MRSSAARTALPAALAVVTLLAVLALAPPAAGQVDANESTTIEVGLQGNGDASVAVTMRMPIDGSEDAEAFDRLAEEHTSGSDAVPSVGAFRTAADRAAEASGRPMTIEDVSRSAGRSDGTGELEVSFTWTNFSRTRGEQVVAGDVFQAQGGTWFTGLTEHQQLRITLPRGYDPDSILMPDTRYRYENRTVYVDGPATFQPESPSIVLQRTDDGGIPADLTTIAGAIGVLVLLALLGYVFRDRFQEAVARIEGETSEPAEATEAEEVEAVDPELLSDEERVLRLLETRGGRMKQVNIVEETDWSNAKVSQLLSEMEESDLVEKLRIGRENLISLPGQGPAAGNSDPGEFD